MKFLRAVLATFRKKKDPKTGTTKWAFLDHNGRVLEWFDKEPSEETKKKAENRVQMFKHMKKKK